MKFRTVIGLTGAAAASLVGVAGLAASPAGASPATTMPADQLSSYLGLPGVPIFAPMEPAGAFPNVKVSGNCDQAPWLFSDPLALNFLSGNSVVYQENVNPNDPVPFFPGGLNAVGTADLIDLGSGDTGFVGATHVWVGQSGNAQGQQYGGETVTFRGTAADGSTISFSVNPGFVQSASGHPSGWGQQNLSCNMVSPG